MKNEEKIQRKNLIYENIKKTEKPSNFVFNNVYISNRAKAIKTKRTKKKSDKIQLNFTKFMIFSFLIVITCIFISLLLNSIRNSKNEEILSKINQEEEKQSTINKQINKIISKRIKKYFKEELIEENNKNLVTEIVDQIVFLFLNYYSEIRKSLIKYEKKNLRINHPLLFSFIDNKIISSFLLFLLILILLSIIISYYYLFNKIKILERKSSSYQEELITQSQLIDKLSKILKEFEDKQNAKIKELISIDKIIKSKIITSQKELQLFFPILQKLNHNINHIYFKLVYSGAKDGDLASTFHSLCDKIGPNLVLVKTKMGIKFGGFTFENWEDFSEEKHNNNTNYGTGKIDENAFCFSLSNNKIYENKKKNDAAIFCCENKGPTFRANIFQINNCFFKLGGWTCSRLSSNFFGQDKDYEITGGEQYFQIEEVEVFEVIFR